MTNFVAGVVSMKCRKKTMIFPVSYNVPGHVDHEVKQKQMHTVHIS